MIISIDDRRGSRWPVPLVLAAVCGLAFFGAGFLQQRALKGKIDDQEAKASALVRQTVVPATKDVGLTKPMSPAVAARLEHDLRKGALAGDSVVRVRIYGQDGSLLFSTDPDEHPSDAKVGDADAIRAASVGSTNSTVGTDHVTSPSGRASSVELLHTYVQLSGGKGKPPGVVGVDQRYEPLAVAAQQPWHTVQSGLEVAAAILVLLGLALLVRRVFAKRATAKASAPKPAKEKPAPESGTEGEEGEKKRSFRKERSSTSPPGPSDAEQARKAAQREMQVREALEGQLEQLRTRIREQEDVANRQVLELTQQLQVAAARVEEAEARAASGAGGVEPERLAAAERQAQEAVQLAERVQARATAAEAHVAELERLLAETQQAATPSNDERVSELERALAEARAEAADNARRAEATEAVREEMEIKVAQFGSRAQEQEATASALADQLREIDAVRADLERRASEAESGGDAVRSEVAQLTSERDALRDRVVELERAAGEPTTTSAAGIEELEQLASARTELHDLRQQLGGAIERAQAAEERTAKLEADLLAERQGVRELADGPGATQGHDEPAEQDEPYPDHDEPYPDPSESPFAWMNGNSNGSTNGSGRTEDQVHDDDEGSTGAEEPAGDKSLRYRLAQSAARKKGLSDLEPPA
jgi:colicin import membrane protein